jgi:hypothetical protein
MNRLLISIVAIAAFGSVAFSTASEPRSRATFLSATDISKVLKKMPPKASADQPVLTLDAGGANVGLFVVRRPQEADQGCTIEHDTLANDKTTSIVFVLKGAGTIVTGGKLANPTPIAFDDPDLKLLGTGNRGSGILDGESRRITPGDVVIIPAGVPHGFSAIEKEITYQVVRIDSGKVLPLK